MEKFRSEDPNLSFSLIKCLKCSISQVELALTVTLTLCSGWQLFRLCSMMDQGRGATNNEKWSTNKEQLHTLSCAWPFKSDTIFCDLLWLASNLWLTVTNVATNPINRSTINGQCDNDNDNESNESNYNNVWAYRKRGYRYKCRYIDVEWDTYNAYYIYRYTDMQMKMEMQIKIRMRKAQDSSILNRNTDLDT